MRVDAPLHMYESGFLRFTSSTLNSSHVEVRGFGYKVDNCVFNNSTISCEHNTMGNLIANSIFNNTSIPIALTSVYDGATTELYVYKTEFYNAGIAINKDMGRITARCCKFDGNETAIFGGDGSVTNISTLYNGGYNYFDNNDYNIKLGNALGIEMNDGYNEFYDGNIMNIEGNFDLNPPCDQILAYNNTWTPLSDTNVPYEDPNHPDQAEFKIYRYGRVPNPPTCLEYFKFGTVAVISTCGQHDDPKDPDDGPKSNDAENEFPLVNTPTYFTDTPFDYAMKVSAYTTTVADTVNGDDMIAADKYYELLYLAEMDSVSSDSIGALIERMLWNSLNNYKATIERLFADSILYRANNQTSFEPTVQNYVTTLMHFTDSIKTVENYKEQFQLEMWKASLMSTIGKNDKALQILTNINFCDHDSLQKIILDKQIQILEYHLMSSQMDAQAFLVDSITFVLDSSIYQIPIANYIDSTGFGSYIQSPNSVLFSSCNTFLAKQNGDLPRFSDMEAEIYPNPAQTQINVSITNGRIQSTDVLTLRMYELSGREVFSANLKAQNSRIELPDLANALFLYRIELNKNLIQQGKISIMK